MAVPSISVPTTPEGWTHIGGPGMQLLLGSHEDDPLTHAASDAADTGDFDAVLDVLVSRGVRAAPPFAGVTWSPVHRVVAFGAVAATVTDTAGEQTVVRATSSRVWTEVELAESPDRVVLEPTDAAEPSAAVSGSQPETVPETVAETGSETVAATAAETLPATGADPGPERESLARPSAPVVPVESSALPPPGLGMTPPGPRPGSPWSGSWMAPAPSPDEPTSPEEPSSPGDRSSAREPNPARDETNPAPDASTPQPTLSAWGSRAPLRPVRATATESAMESAAKPNPEPKPEPQPEPEPIEPDAHSTMVGRPEPDVSTAEPGQPSYDYLFGRTSDAEAHRAMLARLEEESEGEAHAQTGHVGDGDAHDEDSAESAASGSSGLGASASQPAPAAPVWNAEAAAPASPDAIISSVPWLSPATASASGDEPRGAEPVEPASRPVWTGPSTPPPPPSLIAVGPPPAPAPSPEPEPTPEPNPEPNPEPEAAPETEVEPDVEPGPQVLPAAEDHPDEDADDADDADEATVDRAALLAARDAVRGDGLRGPTVVAVLCSSGHPSPAHAVLCRVCGQNIPSQEPFTMARPSLGTLTLSTGDVVELDRNVLIGRAPRLDPNIPPSERPHVLKVPSPERDISRNHVEIVLEGWHVLVRDLETLNGTTVTLPGAQPVRLRADDQQVLEPGSRVTMAEDISFVYEVTA